MLARAAAHFALLLVLLLPVGTASAQVFGRLEGLETSTAFFTFARPGDATKRIYMWGAIRSPGIYEVEVGTDMSALLSLAGGPVVPVQSDERQQRATVRLYRPDGSGEDVRRLVFTARVDSLLLRPLPSPQEGDVVEVTVTERRIRTWRDDLTVITTGASLVTVILSVVSLIF